MDIYLKRQWTADFDSSQDQKLYWKLGQQSAICWNSLGLFRDYTLFENESITDINYPDLLAPDLGWI